MFPTSMQLIEPQTELGQKDLKAHEVLIPCHRVLHDMSFTGLSSPKPFVCSIKGTWQRFLVLGEDTRKRHMSVKQLVVNIGDNKKYKTRQNSAKLTDTPTYRHSVHSDTYTHAQVHIYIQWF